MIGIRKKPVPAVTLPCDKSSYWYRFLKSGGSPCILNHLKSGIMKWNAIISRSQYEKTVRREREISRDHRDPAGEDELRLLRILIKDYEERQSERWSADWRRRDIRTGNCYPSLLQSKPGTSGV